jgi:hypothetical protein
MFTELRIRLTLPWTVRREWILPSTHDLMDLGLLCLDEEQEADIRFQIHRLI